MANGQDDARIVFELVETTQPTPEGGAPAATPAGGRTPAKSETTRRREDADAAVGGGGARIQDRQGGVATQRTSQTALKDFALEAGASRLGRLRAPIEAAIRQFGGMQQAVAAGAGEAAAAGKAGSTATAAARGGQAATAAGGAGGALAAAGPALAAGGIAIAAVAATVGTFRALSAAQASAVERTVGLSPEVASARAQGDVQRLLADLRSARQFGTQFAEAEQASTQLDIARRELWDSLAASTLGQEVTEIKEIVTEALIGLRSGVELLESVSPPALIKTIRDLLREAGILPEAFPDLKGQSIFEELEHLPVIFPRELQDAFGGNVDPIAIGSADVPFIPALP